MSTEEALVYVHGEMQTIRDGEVTHQAVQTNLADVICGGESFRHIQILSWMLAVSCQVLHIPETWHQGHLISLDLHNQLLGLQSAFTTVSVLWLIYIVL
jgi:hypothetical protein